jgi:hypothetical protein
MALATHYELLTDGEKAHWDEYATLRSISDWAGFTAEQDQRRADARAWLQARRKEIWRLAQPQEKGGDGKGWDVSNRRERYETLKDKHLNTATVQRRETTLPANGALDSERALIEEREIWLQIDSTTDAQKARRQACTDWLIAQRKQLWHLMRDDPDGNEANYRQQRYDNLCIATRHGSAYEAWDKTHDEYGKSEKKTSARDIAIKHLEKRVGYTEDPSGSNFDNRSDGIRTAQRATAGGGTWLDRQPWCGCWCFYAAQAAGVAGIDSHMASVAQIEDFAKAGQKCYRGWTTDLSRARPGDLAVIGGYGVHVETVRGSYANGKLPTHGGNTSPGSSGSQSNGGGAFERDRSSSEVRGIALMDYPD